MEYEIIRQSVIFEVGTEPIVEEVCAETNEIFFAIEFIKFLNSMRKDANATYYMRKKAIK